MGVLSEHRCFALACWCHIVAGRGVGADAPHRAHRGHGTNVRAEKSLLAVAISRAVCDLSTHPPRLPYSLLHFRVLFQFLAALLIARVAPYPTLPRKLSVDTQK